MSMPQVHIVAYCGDLGYGAARGALHHAVEIDGEAYWDGGFTANPAIYPLMYECSTPDILLVLLNPLSIAEVPRTAEEIAARIDTMLHAMGVTDAGIFGDILCARTLRQLTDRLVKELATAGKGSKLNATRAFLHELRDLGRARGESWVREHRPSVGKRSTVDLAALFA